MKRTHFLRSTTSIARRSPFNRLRIPAVVRQLFGACVVVLPLCSSAQIILGSNVSTNLSTNVPVVSVTQRGANFQKWQRVTASRNALGQTVHITNRFTELSTGAFRLIGTNWIATSNNIQITSEGGVATNTAHQVSFAANINTSEAIQLATPDGKLLKSHVVGIAYFDSFANTNVLFATPRDRVGNVVRANQVIYTNAFAGTRADIRYTQRRSGFEQDIIFRERLPSPASLGLNARYTKLQVWTEFVDPPKPQIVQDASSDRRLDFGAMKMEQGRAFFADEQSNAVPVMKHWVRSPAGRTYLVEEIPLSAVAAQLNTLPSASNSLGTNAMLLPRFRGFPNQMPPPARLAGKGAGGLNLASHSAQLERGLVMDYAIVNGTLTDVTFASDETYFVGGPTDLYGTTTIEGGTVIKYTNAPGDPAYLWVHDDFHCQTAPYRPAILTSSDDDSVGEVIPGSSGTPGLLGGSTYLYWPNGGAISNLHFAYSWNAFGADTGDVQIWNCQFIKCSHPITITPGNTNMGLHNVLITMDDVVNDSSIFCGCPPAAITGYSENIHFYGEHVTADLQSQSFVLYYGYVYTPSNVIMSLTNSMVISPNLNPSYMWGGAVGNTVSTNSTYYSNSAAGVFQTVEGGHYYLATNSPYRDIGTTNISPALALQLGKKTTFPPMRLTNDVVLDTTLNPVVLRDTNTPDLGWHYDPLDYIASNVNVGPSAGSAISLSLTNGIAIGITGTNGLRLYRNTQLVSTGTPIDPNRVLPCPAVQESGAMGASFFDFPEAYSGSYPPPILKCRFTDFASLGLQSALFSDAGQSTRPFTWLMRDSSFANLSIWAVPDVGADTITIGLTNNVFERCLVTCGRTHYFNTGSAVAVLLCNNLFWNGEVDLMYDDYSGTNWPIWKVNNNAFDSVSLWYQGTYDYCVPTKNGYINTTAISGDSSPVNLSGFNYAVGPLGKWYQSSMDFQNAGNTNAGAVGLYHFTTTTNQVKEKNTVVDIGYHYVALDAYGRPVDSNGDGIADYLHDSNGNGVFDNGVDLGNWEKVTIIIQSPTNGAVVY